MIIAPVAIGAHSERFVTHRLDHSVPDDEV
jgi:hypothetical protein